MACVRRAARRGMVWLAMAVGLGGSAQAHDAFAEYVWHRVELGLAARQLDVTVTLTFFEEWSERERRSMDADGDGRIGRSELDGYAAKLARAVNSEVSLFVAGRRIALVPLYEPEVDLLGRATVGPAHHQLTLHFFATLPPGLAPDAPIVVESRLWPDAASFGEITAAAASSGGRIRVAGVTERNPAASGGTRPLRFKATLAGPPPPAAR